jgi:hypothetical protein
MGGVFLEITVDPELCRGFGDDKESMIADRDVDNKIVCVCHITFNIVDLRHRNPSLSR